MVRLSYHYEMRSAITYPLAASLAEGSFTGVVAAKYFQASPLLIALITAAPMFGNIMAMIWAEKARGRRKVPFVNLLQLGVVGSIAAVALTAFVPRTVGAWLFAALIIVVRLLASGIVTVRAAIWRANYPRHLRAQITGRITIVSTVVLAFATCVGASWLDADPRAFVYLYPIAAVMGAVGIWQFSRIRVRSERQALRRETIPHPRPEALSHTDEMNVLNYQPPEQRRGLLDFLREARDVLRRDRAFREYQWWQFLSGASFMMLNPPLVLLVSKELTDPHTQYKLATVVLQIIPMIMSIVATQFWAPLFDRLHITAFRVFQGIASVAAQATIFVGAVLGQLWIIAAGQFVLGISLAGGNLAWNLGHNDFATREQAATYMGVHVMLTGLRGCFAPFAGVMLFRLPFIRRGVFGISVLMCLAALLGFVSMARRMGAWHKTRHDDAGAAAAPAAQPR